MRVAVNGRFLTQPVSGVQRYAREMVATLASTALDRIELILVVPSGNLSDVPHDVQIVKDATVLPATIWEQARLPFLVRKLGADVLWSPCNLGPLRVERHFVTVHDASVFAGPSWFAWWYSLSYRFLLRVLGESAVRVLTDSRFSMSELAKWRVASPEKIRVVPGGVSDRFHPSATRPERLKSTPYVLAVSSWDPRKNFRRLLRAWSELPRGVKRGFKLVVAGGTARKFRDEAISVFPPDVLFLGYIDDGELPGLYAGAELLVYPSLYEGFGLPPLEAMACGTPTLVSRIPPLVELCADAAAYCDPQSVGSIREELRLLLSSSDLRAKLAAAGRERAKRFTWEAAARDLVAAFEEWKGQQ